MLRSIRGNAKGVGAKIIVGLIAFSFIGFGAVDFFSDGGVKDVLKINGQSIDEIRYSAELELLKNEVRTQMGENVDHTLLENDFLAEPAYDRLIKKVVVEQALDNMNVVVPDTLINANITGTPDFQQDGRFSNQLFRRILSENGMDTNFYKARLREQIAERNINVSIGLSNFSLASERQALMNIVNESREIQWVKIAKNQVGLSVEVSEDDLLAYYEDNKAAFQSKPAVELEYIQLSLVDFYPEISEEEVKAEFDRQLSLFDAAEKRAVSHILLQLGDELSEEAAKEKLQDITSQFQSGETFSALAKEHSSDIGSAASGGSLGYLEKDGTFFPEFEEAVFALELNKISAPVETEAGWHLILVTDIQTEEAPVYEMQKAQILTRLQQVAANKDYAIALDSFKDIAYNALDLQEPAEEFGLTIKTTAKLEQENTDPLFSDARLMTAAFSTDVYQDGLNSEVVELSDSSSLVLRLKEKHESRQLELDEVQTKIEQLVIQEKIAQAMEGIVAEIKSSISSGVTFSEAISKAGYELSEPVSVNRNSTEVDRELISEVFKAPRQNLESNDVSSFVSQAGDAYLFDVQSISRLSEAESVAEDVLKRTLENAKGQSDVSTYIEELKLAAEIERF